MKNEFFTANFSTHTHTVREILQIIKLVVFCREERFFIANSPCVNFLIFHTHTLIIAKLAFLCEERIFVANSLCVNFYKKASVFPEFFSFSTI